MLWRLRSPLASAPSYGPLLALMKGPMGFTRCGTPFSPPLTMPFSPRFLSGDYCYGPTAAAAAAASLLLSQLHLHLLSGGLLLWANCCCRTRHILIDNSYFFQPKKASEAVIQKMIFLRSMKTAVTMAWPQDTPTPVLPDLGLEV